MKITKARIHLASIGVLHPVFIEIETDEGISGIGEAGIAYGQGGTAAAGMILDLARRFAIGRDPFRIEELYSEMYDHSFWGKRGGAIVFAGISAIETALWDIKGKALGVPIYELLGGAFRDEVEVYANGWWADATTVDELARAAERTVADGYTALKFYPLARVRAAADRNAIAGSGIKHVDRRMIDADFATEAVRRVAAVRAAVGPDVRLMLDLSGGLTPDETIRLCRRWEEHDILFVEEPADPADIGALRRISQAISIPIAAGERFYTRHDFRDALEQRVLDIAQPDIGNTGGIMETKKIAAMAETYGLRVQPHICGGPIATAAALQIDACIPNFMIQELYPYRPRELFALVDDAPDAKVVGGRMPIPRRPGLGVTLDRERARPFVWAEC